MAMVVVDDSSLQADSQPKSRGLVWGSVAAWRYSTFIKWTEWTLAMTLWSWWQHYKHCHGIIIIIIIIIQDPSLSSQGFRRLLKTHLFLMTIAALMRSNWRLRNVLTYLMFHELGRAKASGASSSMDRLCGTVYHLAWGHRTLHWTIFLKEKLKTFLFRTVYLGALCGIGEFVW